MIRHFPDRETVLHEARKLYYAVEEKEGHARAIKIVSKEFHVNPNTVRVWKVKGFELRR